MSTTPNPVIDDPSVGAPIAGDPGPEPSPSPEPEPVEPETPGQPEPEQEPGAQPEPTPESKEDARKLPQHIRDLKESNPEGYKRAKAEFFDLTARRSIHPTVQAARDEHELLAANGGAEGIAKLREDGQFFKTAATQFLKGDPAFVKDLWDEDPIAAALHVPTMLDAFREKDRPGYNATLCRLWDTEFQAVGLVDKGFKPLRAAILAGDKDAAAEILDSIEKWQQSISGVARQAEDPRVKALLAERAKAHETREQSEREEFLKGYRTDTVNAVVEDAAKVFDSFFKGRKIDQEDRTDLLREAFAMADRLVMADKGFAEQRDAHLANGDAAAAKKLTLARYMKEMPNAVKRIARRYGMFAGPAKPTPAGNGQPEPGQQPRQPTAPQGWIKVNARPQAEDIDRSRTTNEMIIGGQAVLRDGRKVSWAHLKQRPAA